MSQQDKINENIYYNDSKIEDIFIKQLTNDFIFLSECSEFFDSVDSEFSDYDKYMYDFIYTEFYHNLEKIDTVTNIFEDNEEGYKMDYGTFIQTCQVLTEFYDSDYFNDNVSFSDLFEISMTDTIQNRVINKYAEGYLKEQIEYNVLVCPIITVYRNIFKYLKNKEKHSGLINLYTKLDNKNKQKKTISKILNAKFSEDIIQNIISAY